MLLKESIDNSIDEFNEGFGKRIEVNIHDNLIAEIRDYGRGIPLGALVDAVSKPACAEVSFSVVMIFICVRFKYPP